MHIPIKKREDVILKLFEFIKNKWEVYLPLKGNNKFIILKTICSKCGADWYIDEKECFSCKLKYFRAIKCYKCGEIIAEENLRHCPKCKSDVGIRGCINCDKRGDGQFVPITFCQKCGNRENKFEFRILKF